MEKYRNRIKNGNKNKNNAQMDLQDKIGEYLTQKTQEYREYQNEADPDGWNQKSKYNNDLTEFRL